MVINGLVWLDEVVEKIVAKHHVTQAEVEEALGSRARFRRMMRGRFRGEDVYAALGRTQAGRHLIVFFIHKRTADALILSARDMDEKERRRYLSK